jgi:hypothetical protein
VVLEALYYVVEHGVQNENPDFSVHNRSGNASLMEEGQELGPRSDGEFNVGNGCHYARDRVADKIAGEKKRVDICRSR